MYGKDFIDAYIAHANIIKSIGYGKILHIGIKVSQGQLKHVGQKLFWRLFQPST